MKELFLRNTRSALVPASKSGEEALASYPKDVILRVKVSQARMLPHHKFFFAFLDEAFEHWPALHAFKPRDADYHLRAWLLVKAGFSEGVDLRPRTVQEAHATVQALKLVVRGLVGDRPFWSKITTDHEGGLIEVRWPMSIAFHNMDEEEFRRVTPVVFAVIYAEAGIDVDDYYRKWQEKNGKLKVEPSRKAA